MNRFSLTKQPVGVMQDIAQKARALRKAEGFTQAELAERSGVSLGSVKRFESSGRISLESLLKLSHALNRLDDFFGILDPSQNQDIDHLFSDKTRRS